MRADGREDSGIGMMRGLSAEPVSVAELVGKFQPLHQKAVLRAALTQEEQAEAVTPKGKRQNVGGGQSEVELPVRAERSQTPTRGKAALDASSSSEDSEKTCDYGSGKPSVQGVAVNHPVISPLVPRRLEAPASTAPALVSISTPPPAAPSAEFRALQEQMAQVQAAMAQQQARLAEAAAVPKETAGDDKLLAQLMERQRQTEATVTNAEGARSATTAAATVSEAKIRALEERIQQLSAPKPVVQDPAVVTLQASLLAANAQYAADTASRDEKIRQLETAMCAMAATQSASETRIHTQQTVLQHAISPPAAQDPQVTQLQGQIAQADAVFTADVAARDERFRQLEGAVTAMTAQQAAAAAEVYRLQGS